MFSVPSSELTFPWALQTSVENHIACGSISLVSVTDFVCSGELYVRPHRTTVFGFGLGRCPLIFQNPGVFGFLCCGRCPLIV
jgi:hypothetical protein